MKKPRRQRDRQPVIRPIPQNQLDAVIGGGDKLPYYEIKLENPIIT